MPQKRPQAVLLDFNDQMDDQKQRKFEEFKQRQMMRQKLRNKSKDREAKQETDVAEEEKTAQLSEVKYAKKAQTTANAKIIRTKATATVYDEDYDDCWNVRVSPSIQQKAV